MLTPTPLQSKAAGSTRPKRGGFANDVFTLTSATSVAQVLAMLAAPLLTRLFSPYAFGLATLFGSTVAIIGGVICLRYELSILLPEADEHASNSLAVSLLCALLVSLLTVPLIALFGKTIFTLIHASDLIGYRWLFPVALFQTGIYLALSNWNTRRGDFGQLSLAQLIATVCTLALQICLGVMGYVSAGVLILSTTFGITIAILILVLGSNWDQVSEHVTWNKIFGMAKRYSRFPKYGIVAVFLNSISWQLPALFLARFFSPSVVGQYALGNRLIRVPMNLVGVNIAKVFFQRAAMARHEGVLSELVENAFRYLLSLSMFPCLLLTFMGKELFVLVFGQTWSEAGIYTQILSVWVCFWFISSPLSIVLDVMEEQALELRINALIFLSRCASLVAGGLTGSPHMTLALFSVSGVLVYGYYSFAILRVSGASIVRMSKELLSNLAIFAPAGLVLALLKKFEMSPLVIVAVALLLLCMYFWNLIRLDPLARKLATNSFKRFFGEGSF